MRIKQETRVHPSHLRGKPDKQRGIQGVNPPFTGIHENVTNGVKRWTLCDRKAQNVNAFFYAKDASSAHLKGQKLTAQGNTLGIKQLAGQKTQAARPVLL